MYFQTNSPLIIGLHNKYKHSSKDVPQGILVREQCGKEGDVAPPK